jgi:NAD(P)-dependent dehydrogenase (short-subunit alcohol dehydrogenase family)
VTDMVGKTVLVTGATSGIGLETAAQISRMGARVIVHGRSREKVIDAMSVIGGELQPLVADLSSFAQVRSAAAEVLATNDRLDVLVNNAGVYMPHRVVTADGFETTLEVNHLAPFLMTNLLLARLADSAPSRVITVSSVAHFRGVLDFDDLNLERFYDPYTAYATTKLMNVMFAFGLAARVAGTGVSSNALHPGVIDTKLLAAGFPRQHGASPAVGAATPVYLASSEEVEDTTGRYFVNQHPAEVSPLARDEALRARLWNVSERMTGLA